MIETSETDKTIRKKLIFCITLISATFLFSMASFLFPELNQTSDSHGVWFQRSGSFMVMASIGAEFILVRTEGYLDPYNEKYMTFTEMPPELNHLHRKLSIAVIILAIYGTVVWGYGDLFI